MPQLILEYSGNITQLDAKKTLLALNKTLVDSSDTIQEGAIKARAYKAEVFSVGTNPDHRGFLHLELSMMAGRDTESKKHIAHNLVETLQAMLPRQNGLEIQFTVNIIDMDPEIYTKVVINS